MCTSTVSVLLKIINALMLLIIWLKALFIAIDANFCLRRKNVLLDKYDPGLSCGYSYIVRRPGSRRISISTAQELWRARAGATTMTQ